MWYRDFFPRSRPRQAKGGIKAQTKRGQFGQSWWAKRWIAVLEGFNIGGRLQRGRSYARSGQVLSIDIGKGKVTAKVQGSQPKPYAVSIAVKQLAEKEWAKLIEVLSGQVLYTAKLLAGEMPPDIEEAFTKTKLSLFPHRRDDLTTSCSCPDYSNPCKHIAAVYYLLGEEFDRDPFLIFQLRGLERKELFARLGKLVPSDAAGSTGSEKAPSPVVEEPLPTDAKAFWSAPRLPDDLFADVSTPPVAAAWPKRLGNFPFWRGSEHLLDALETTYRPAGQKGMAIFQGESRAAEADPTVEK